MAFAAVSCDTVWLLEALAAELTGESQGSHRLCMLAPMPVQGRLLAAGEPADLTPEPGTAEGRKGPRPILTSPGVPPGPNCPDVLPAPPHFPPPRVLFPTLTAGVSLQCGCAGG